MGDPTLHGVRQAIEERCGAGATPPGTADTVADEELVAQMQIVLEESEFVGGGFRKAWARLRMKGERTCKGRTLRLMAEHDLLAPIRGRRPHGPKAHYGTITTAGQPFHPGRSLT